MNRRALRFGIGLCVLLATAALASDITQCGQTVSAGDVGVLMVDLVCPNMSAVTVSNGGTLELNGHSISAPGASAVAAEFVSLQPGVVPRRRFSVVGPGTIYGSDTGIEGVGGIRVSMVTIHDTGRGITTTKDDKRGKLNLTNVTITQSSDPTNGIGVVANKVVANGLTVTGMPFNGISVVRISGADVIASGNGPGVPSLGVGFGVDADKAMHLKNLTANDNSGAGAFSEKIVLRDSTVTGNMGAITDPNTHKFTGDIDVFTDSRPTLVNTVCGKSYNPGNDASWHVCQNDSPSGAFLDTAGV
jgi:hypothetical protein